ncbi:MAG: helix-turn-helix domain-containing protein [Gelidibacter sp.]
MEIESRNRDFEFYLNSDSIDIVALHNWNTSMLKPYAQVEIYLRSTLFILVLSGKMKIEINHNAYTIEAENIVLLSLGHFFRIQKFSRDFQCISLYVSNAYAQEMFSADMMYKRMKYGIEMYQKPIFSLQHIDFGVLNKRIEFLREILNQTQHLYQKEMILNALRIYFLDLTNIIEANRKEILDAPPSRDEVYFLKFLDLLAHFYKTEHLVDFYADKIFITPHYLTIIVKRLSGQTVSDFIYQLLFSEAKELLLQPYISIQQIAEKLNFSDQSAFGKFFKKRSGYSPKEYRKLAH